MKKYICRNYTVLFFLLSLNLFLYSQETVDNINELRELSPGSASVVSVEGYYQPGDGGGGTFQWNGASNAPDNGGTIIAPNAGGSGRWIRDVHDHFNVKWFGAQTANELTGTVSISSGSNIVTGTGTQFTQEVSTGDKISIGWYTVQPDPETGSPVHYGHHRLGTVASVVSNTQLTLTESVGSVASGNPFHYNGIPGMKAFTGIGEFHANETYIRAALDAIIDYNVKKVYVPSGVFLLMDTFSRSENVLNQEHSGLTLFGDGGDPQGAQVSSFKWHPGRTNPQVSGSQDAWLFRMRVVDFDGSVWLENVTVKDIYFDGSFSQMHSARVIYIQYAKDCKIENVWVEKWGARVNDRYSNEVGGGGSVGVQLERGTYFIDNIHSNDNHVGFVFDGRGDIPWGRVTAENISASRNGIWGEIGGRQVGFGLIAASQIEIDIKNSEFSHNWIGMKTDRNWWEVRFTDVQFNGNRNHVFYQAGANPGDSDRLHLYFNNVTVDGTITDEILIEKIEMDTGESPPFWGSGAVINGPATVTNSLIIKNVKTTGLILREYEGRGGFNAERVIIRAGGYGTHDIHRAGLFVTSDFADSEAIINYLEVEDPNGPGVIIANSGGVTVKSGKISGSHLHGIWVRDGRTLRIGNTKIFGNTEGSFNNEGTVKYTRLEDGQGNPITPSGNAVRLPDSEINSAAINGTSATLYFEGNTEQPGRSISSIELYRYIPGSENPLNNIQDILIDTKNGPGPHVTTIQNLVPDENYRFFTIAIDNAGDEGLEPFDFYGNLQNKLVRIHSQDIYLNSGWNGISSHIDPGTADLTKLFAEIQNNVQLVTNANGDVYHPADGVNEIGQWNISEAYRVFMKQSDNLVLRGELINPQSLPLNLRKGVNIVPYYVISQMSITNALKSISEQVEIVTDGDGNVYWPRREINNIGNMEPGKGYYIHVNEDVTLIYSSDEN